MRSWWKKHWCQEIYGQGLSDTAALRPCKKLVQKRAVARSREDDPMDELAEELRRSLE